MKTILLMRSVPRIISPSRAIDNALRCRAISMAPIAPTPAASVGVAKPPSIDPSTAKIRMSGGASALITLPIDTSSSSDETCAGMESGFTMAVNMSQSTYRRTSSKPGISAPANKSPTETVSGEKIPWESCARWYADDMTSPSMTRMIDGGMICPSVPDAQMMPVEISGE